MAVSARVMHTNVAAARGAGKRQDFVAVSKCLSGKSPSDDRHGDFPDRH
jgi:hypothetical protein